MGAISVKLTEKNIEKAFFEGFDDLIPSFTRVYSTSAKEINDFKKKLKIQIDKRGKTIHDDAFKSRREYLGHYDTNGNSHDSFKLIFFYTRAILKLVDVKKKERLKTITEYIERKKNALSLTPSDELALEKTEKLYKNLQSIINATTVNLLNKALKIATGCELSYDIRKKIFKVCGNYDKYQDELGKHGLYLIYKSHLKACYECNYFKHAKMCSNFSSPVL